MNTMTPTMIPIEPTTTCPSAIVRQAWSNKVKRQTQTMTAGPHLDAEGHTLIVPSAWYNQAAAILWSQFGFHWNNGSATWERDTRLPLRKDGKRYTTDAWLTSTRKQFYQFWPTLLKECRYCGTRFARTNEYQVFCIKCTRERQAATRFHDTNQ